MELNNEYVSSDMNELGSTGNSTSAVPKRSIQSQVLCDSTNKYKYAACGKVSEGKKTNPNPKQRSGGECESNKVRKEKKQGEVCEMSDSKSEKESGGEEEATAVVIIDSDDDARHPQNSEGGKHQSFRSSSSEATSPNTSPSELLNSPSPDIGASAQLRFQKARIKR